MNPVQSNVTYRRANIDDVPAILRSRLADPDWGPADPRTASYLQGTHHPQRALHPRALFVALQMQTVVGYIAGHQTERYACDGELQYLWVAIQHRRRGVASKLFELLVRWFKDQGASRICVDVLPDNLAARSFYSRHGAVELNPHWLIWNDITSEPRRNDSSRNRDLTSG